MPNPEIRPALDLRGGRVVRLGEHGDFASETAFADGPSAAVALGRRYVAAGARRLHVVDLDAARGSGDNRAVVSRLVAEAGADVEVAGGIRSFEDAERWLEAGAEAVILGTAAVRDPALLSRLAEQHAGRVMAALDVRNGQPAVTGWVATEDVGVGELLERWEALPLAGVVLTSVDRDGTLAGPDLPLLRLARQATSQALVYSGGVASKADVEAVGEAGAGAVILGRALLEGRIPLQILSRF